MDISTINKFSFRCGEVSLKGFQKNTSLPAVFLQIFCQTVLWMQE